MPDHDAVAAALARLANGAPQKADAVRRTAVEDDQPMPADPTSVVADAAEALTRLSTAAAFVESGGEQRLSRAIDDARRTGDAAVADRGAELLAALDRVRAAADGEAAPAEGRRAADHFHHGRATLLAGGGIDPER